MSSTTESQSAETLTRPTERSTRAFARLAWDALRGTGEDYTDGPLGRSLVLLAIPMIVEMLMESAFGIVDMWVVSRLGSDAVATVALTESMLVLLMAVAMGIGISSMATVARRIGAKDRDGASVAAVQAILLAAMVAIPVGIGGALFARPILELMGAEPGVLDIGTTYTRIILGGSGTILLLVVINSVLRGAGDAAVTMRVLWLANAINIVLAPCLVFGVGPFPELGVTGAAVATTIGRGSGVLYQLWYLASGRARLRVRLSDVRIDPVVLRAMSGRATQVAGQFVVGMSSWFVLVRIVATFGSNAVASYGIALRVMMTALMPAMGLAGAAATLVGQGLGAGKPDRAEAAVWLAARSNAVFLGSVGALFLLFAPNVVGVFTTEAVVQSSAATALRIASGGFVFYAFGMVLRQAFNGAGDSGTATLLNFFTFWVFELPLAWLLAIHFELGVTGAFLAIALAFSADAVVSAMVFKRGRWRTRRV